VSVYRHHILMLEGLLET